MQHFTAPAALASFSTAWDGARTQHPVSVLAFGSRPWATQTREVQQWASLVWVARVGIDVDQGQRGTG